MSRILFVDCFSGVSGDMLLGALVDAGVDVARLRSELGKLGVEGWAIRPSTPSAMASQARGSGYMHRSSRRTGI